MANLAVWLLVLMFGASIGTIESFFPLDMALTSVDDMYAGCKDKMEKKVKTEFLLNEKNKEANFTVAWNDAEKYYNKKWNRRHGKKPSGTLQKEHIMAIYVYTLDKPEIYREFNKAVRTQRFKYKTTFKYHTLHFFLTDALQALNSHKPQEKRCITGFRRVNGYFREGALNKQIRFGSFASSSMGWYPRPEKFGEKTCFEIYTCFGVDISLYSKLGESEREVLIPPYEVFKITKIEKRSEKKNLPCEFVYSLKSTGKALSHLNCSLF